MNVTLTSKGKEAADFAVSVMDASEDDIRWQLSHTEIQKLRPPLSRVRNMLRSSEPAT